MSEAKTPAEQIRTILDQLRAQVDVTAKAYDAAQSELHEALEAAGIPPSPVPANPAAPPEKRTRNPRPLKPQPDGLPEGIVAVKGGYRVAGSVVTHASVEAAVKVRDGVEG